VGIAVSLVEILVGVLVGNLFHLPSATWIDFLAGFGSGLLTFLAGAEIEPQIVGRHWKQTLSIGFASFLLPFLLALVFARFVAGWDWKAAEIAGIALSTTSVAVVYAVMVETGFNETNLGRVILAACFVTDLGTVLALGLLFAHFNWVLVAFIVSMAIVLPLAPRLVRLVIRTTGGRMSEAELKPSSSSCSASARSRRRAGANRSCPPISSAWCSPARSSASARWCSDSAPWRSRS
jgi:Kef-type K+ transport system membrane component KefB